MLNYKNRLSFKLRLMSAQDDPFYSWPIDPRSTIDNRLPTVVVNPNSSRDYTSAPRILSLRTERNLELGFTDDELGHYRQGLGAFQHLPCDFRLHHPFDAFTKQEMLACIKSAADFIHCLETDCISSGIRIYDCDSATGLHAYSAIEYRRNETRLKVTPECEEGLNASWSRLMSAFTSQTHPAYPLTL